MRLRAGGSARCPIGTATLEWNVLNGAAGQVSLDVVKAAAPSAAALAVSQTGRQKVLIAALPEAVAVVASPAAGGTFGNGVTVSAQLTLRVGGADAGQYLLPSADVSGTPRMTLLLITPQAGFWQLDVPHDVAPPETAAVSGSTGVPDAEPPVELDGLAQAAAYAARRRAGSARLTESQRTELHLAVDRSASLLPLVRGGSGQAILDLLLGVNTVVGSAATIGLWTLGNLPTPLRPDLTRGNADGRWGRDIGDRASTGGTLVAPLVARTSDTARATTVLVLTDGPPADLRELEAALLEARSAGSRTRWHVWALARSLDDPQVRLEPWRDELSRLSRLATGGLLTYSAITPGHDDGWLPAVLADVTSLERTIAALPFWDAR